MVNYHAGFPVLSAPGRQISGYLPAFGSRTTLTRIPFCCLFLVTSFGALLSASCRSSSFPLERLSGLGCQSSHQWCNVNKTQGRFGERKNVRLIDKNPPNPADIKEENQGRKDLIVVQSSRINLCGQWCVELLSLQSTIVVRVTPGRSHPTAFLPYRKFSQPRVGQQIPTRDRGSFPELALQSKAIYHHNLGRH